MNLKIKTMSKYIIIIIVGMLTTVSSCSVNKFVSTPKEISTFVNGMYFKGEKTKGNTLNRFFSGEIISVEEDGMHLLTFGKVDTLIYLSKNKIKKGKISIALSSDSPEKYAAWGIINFLPFAHGVFGVITLPITAITTSAIISDATRGGYRIGYPKEIAWEDMHKFARFPQGIPPNVDLRTIKRLREE